ncbi:unnamed protein product [Boreogadus saida]
MQTRLGLTNCPGTRPSRARSNSHTMMRKMASLLLILYGLGQIPLAQGQILRNDETMEITPTWNGQESGAGTEGSSLLKSRQTFLRMVRMLKVLFTIQQQEP